MIENVGFILPWTLFICAVYVGPILVYAAVKAGTQIWKLQVLGAIVTAILVIQSILAWSGFYLELQVIPPRFIVAAPPAIVLLLLYLVFLVPRSSEPLRVLTLLHTVRIPVELVLWGLYLNGQVPKLMTFEGVNLDILSGLTAPLVAWIGFRDGQPRRALLIVWNLLALALLVNIVWHAVLSVPTPFQRYGFDQPNVGVLYFPFILLPALIVPCVLTAHVWSLRELFRKEDQARV